MMLKPKVSSRDYTINFYEMRKVWALIKFNKKEKNIEDYKGNHNPWKSLRRDGIS